MSELPSDLWRTIYDIQGEAQQAAEGDRPCRSIEDTWARLEKVLPKPYNAAPDLLEALKGMIPSLDQSFDAVAVIERAEAAIARAEGTGPNAPPADK